MVCKECILLFRLIICILYSFTRVVSTFYVELLFTHAVAWMNLLSSSSTAVSEKISDRNHLNYLRYFTTYASLWYPSTIWFVSKPLEGVSVVEIVYTWCYSCPTFGSEFLLVNIKMLTFEDVMKVNKYPKHLKNCHLFLSNIDIES